MWVREINLNYFHKELTGDVDQQHNLDKQQHQNVAETINMVTKNKFRVPSGYEGLSTANKGHAVNKIINRSVGRRKNMDTCQTMSMNEPVGSKLVNSVK